METRKKPANIILTFIINAICILSDNHMHKSLSTIQNCDDVQQVYEANL